MKPRRGHALVVVTDSDGETVAFGWRQAEWLEDRGELEHVGGAHWRATARGAHELNALVLATKELRECDFCTAPLAGWILPMRAPIEHPTLHAKIDRSIFACDACLALFRGDHGTRLVERILSEVRRQGRERGLSMPSQGDSRRALGPQLERLISDVQDNLDGEPVLDSP